MRQPPSYLSNPGGEGGGSAGGCRGGGGSAAGGTINALFSVARANMVPTTVALRRMPVLLIFRWNALRNKRHLYSTSSC